MACLPYAVVHITPPWADFSMLDISTAGLVKCARKVLFIAGTSKFYVPEEWLSE